MGTNPAFSPNMTHHWPVLRSNLPSSKDTPSVDGKLCHLSPDPLPAGQAEGGIFKDCCVSKDMPAISTM